MGGDSLKAYDAPERVRTYDILRRYSGKNSTKSLPVVQGWWTDKKMNNCQVAREN